MTDVKTLRAIQYAGNRRINALRALLLDEGNEDGAVAALLLELERIFEFGG